MKKLYLREAQQMINDWFEDIGVRHFSQLTNLGQLTEEVGEVARIMIRQYGDQSFKESDLERDLGDELADVLFTVICIADQADVDLTDSFLKKMEKRVKRDTKRHQQNKKIN